MKALTAAVLVTLTSYCTVSTFAIRPQHRFRGPIGVPFPFPFPAPFPAHFPAPFPAPFPVPTPVGLPQPYPVPVRQNVPVPVPVPDTRFVNVPYPVPVPVYGGPSPRDSAFSAALDDFRGPIGVPFRAPVPFPEPVPFPAPFPSPFPAPFPVPTPVGLPQPYPVPVRQNVPYPVPVPVYGGPSPRDSAFSAALDGPKGYVPAGRPDIYVETGLKQVRPTVGGGIPSGPVDIIGGAQPIPQPGDTFNSGGLYTGGFLPIPVPVENGNTLVIVGDDAGLYSTGGGHTIIASDYDNGIGSAGGFVGGDDFNGVGLTGGTAVGVGGVPVPGGVIGGYDDKGGFGGFDNGGKTGGFHNGGTTGGFDNGGKTGGVP